MMTSAHYFLWLVLKTVSSFKLIFQINRIIIKIKTQTLNNLLNFSVIIYFNYYFNNSANVIGIN